MNGRCSSKPKRRLITVATVAITLQAANVLAGGYASGWDCQTTPGGDWQCRTSQNEGYRHSLEQISEQREQITGTLAWLKVNAADLSRQIAANLPVTPKPDIPKSVMPEPETREMVVAGQGVIKRQTSILPQHNTLAQQNTVPVQSVQRPKIVDRLPVRPVTLNPRLSYVRKESVITQDYQAPVMAPGLPVRVPDPLSASLKPLSVLPVDKASSVPALKMSAPGSHTIQWYAAETLVEARNFKAHHASLKNALVVKTRNQNRTWYLVLQGIYRDSRQAMTALQQPEISRTASTLSPWVRPVAGLQMLQAAGVVSHPVVKRSQVITMPPPSRSVRQQDTVVRAVVKPAPKVIKPIKPEPVASRLLQSPDNHFTIQWFADNRLAKVQQFQKFHPKLADARIVHFRRGDKDWYVLLSGVFANNRQAVGFLKSDNWRKLARQLNPWTRSFKGLKKLSATEIASL